MKMKQKKFWEADLKKRNLTCMLNDKADNF